MKPCIVVSLAALAAGLALLAAPALAQTAPRLPPAPAAAAPDPVFEAARLQFESLPEAERRSVQDALIWTGDFQGVTSGAFGRRTMEALNAYAARLQLPANGTLDAKSRAELARTAATAKAAAGFAVAAEPRSRVIIGVPAKLLPKLAAGPSGQRYAASDDSASLQTFALTGTDADLKTQFERLSAGTAARKVTYKLLRPDFFVVTGEAAGQIFYTRMASAQLGVAPALRGFTFSYAAGKKATMERVSLAVSNSFDPNWGNSAAVAVAGGAAAGAPVAAPVAPAAPKPVLSATGLSISGTQVAAALPAAGCIDPQVGKSRAKIAKTGKAAGLALLDAPGQALPPLAVSAATSGEVVVVYFDAATQALVATNGEIIEASPPRLRAPLQGGLTGGVAFDRTGAFAGLVQPHPPAPGGGPATYGFFAANEALELAGAAAAGVPGKAKSTGEIVAAVKSALVPVLCAK